MFVFRIRPMLLSDFLKVKEIERKTSLSIWSLEGLKAELSRPDSICLVAESGEVIGFAVLRLITSVGEAEILNFGVDPNFQRQGIGTGLMQRLKELLENEEISDIWLEARKSNIKALEFYRRQGFVAVGCRKNFYRNPSEDAILMKLEIKNRP